MIWVLFKIGIKSYFKNKTTIFWSFAFVLVWIFIYAYAFPSPGKSDLLGAEASYISFILLFGVSIVSSSVAFNTASVNLSKPYITRFDNVKRFEIYSGNFLSSLTFSLSVAIFAILVSFAVFTLRFGQVKIASITLLVVTVSLISIFYILLGIFLADVLILTKQVKALRFIVQIPMILVFVFVLGLQIFRIPSKYLIYLSPFNEEFTLAMMSFVGIHGISNIYPFTINIYECIASLIIWVLLLFIGAFLVERGYEKSDYKGQYSLEDISR